MPHGCWIDLYETPDLSGHRRRLFGPCELDAFVWRRLRATDVLSIRVGPRATAQLALREGPARAFRSGEMVSDILAGEVESLKIARAGAAERSAEPRASPHRRIQDAVVRRDVGDPSPPRSKRRRKRPPTAADQTAAEEVRDADDAA